MDQAEDGVMEIVVELESGVIPWELILYYNFRLGRVQGYIFPFRGMKDILIDGTFDASNSASDSGRYRLKFTQDWYEMVPVEYRWDVEEVYWRDMP